MAEQLQPGNGAEPVVKRGRGRPRKVRVPVEAFTADQVRDALAEADRIEAARKKLGACEAAKLHPSAFATARRLRRQGPAEARDFYTALGIYLAADGLLEAP